LEENEIAQQLKEFHKEYFPKLLKWAKDQIEQDKEREKMDDKTYVCLTTLSLFLSSERLEKLTNRLNWLTVILAFLAGINIIAAIKIFL